MRKWRVGTLSMSVTLIALGIGLLIRLGKGSETTLFFLDWWPLVFILLGGELLLQLILSGQKDSPIRYDVFSILFVGLICSGGLILALLTSTGIMTEVREAIGGTERSVSLPEFRETVGSETKKIVVTSHQSNLVIRREDAGEMFLFGTYRQQLNEGKPVVEVNKADFAAIRKSGSTLYVEVKALPLNHGIHTEYQETSATLVVPSTIAVEINGPYQTDDQSEKLP
ncbi:MAG: hypothetical protein H7X86_06245 [Gorillibacterium sp.]|nr:hypothetical protein [Gorillibacterium sp.]